MHVYSRVAEYTVRPSDPDEYRVVLAEGVRRAVGLAPTDIAARELFGFLDVLAEKLDGDAYELAGPCSKLQTLAKNLIEVRPDTTKPEHSTPQALQNRASELQDIRYWNRLAAELFQGFTWLENNANFVGTAVAPPPSGVVKAHTMALDLGENSGK